MGKPLTNEWRSMAVSSTRTILQSIGLNLDESMGKRPVDSRPQLSPVVSAKDLGRRPLRTFGRVDIEQVIPDPGQPRSDFSPEAIERLAESIREKGQLHPIRVRWSEELSKWIIISGERRWRATKHAGLSSIDCYFQETDLRPAEILEQQLVENLLREDLRPMEEARAFAALMELNHWNGKQVAEALRVHSSKVSRSLALLDLPEAIQRQVDSGEMGSRTAYELRKLASPEQSLASNHSPEPFALTAKKAAAIVRQRKGKPVARRGTHQTFFADGGWQVIVQSPTKGTYQEMELALGQALDEVRHYIAQGRVR